MANVVGANEVGANEVGANEVGANVVGANEVGANEVGANEVGANEVGANEVGVYIVNGIEFEKRQEGYFYKDKYLWDINYIFNGTLTLMNVNSPRKLQLALGDKIFEKLVYRVIQRDKKNSSYTQCDSCCKTRPKKYWSDEDYETCKECLNKIEST
jgi:hypothetical protein